jgi:predicted amidohydrolase
MVRAAIFQSSTAGLAPPDRLERLHRAAAEAEADLLLCPELFLSGYTTAAEARRHAEPADGPFAAGVARIAQATGTAIVYGYPEAADGALYNAAQCIDAGGKSLANHRKLVLPPGFESEVFATGKALTLFELNGIRFGLLICYDVEFPEAARATARAGAQAILAPTALAAQWTAVAEQVVPARAFENGVYLLYANHAGAEGDVRYLGASCVVGPDGSVHARAGETEEVIAAGLDPLRVEAAQSRLPYHRDLAALLPRLV